jgi:hypothetical protein
MTSITLCFQPILDVYIPYVRGIAGVFTVFIILFVVRAGGKTNKRHPTNALLNLAAFTKTGAIMA